MADPVACMARLSHQAVQGMTDELCLTSTFPICKFQVSYAITIYAKIQGMFEEDLLLVKLSSPALTISLL